MPWEARSLAAVSLSRFRLISSWNWAIFRPNVVGSACMPWVLPIIGVNLWACAFSFSTAMNAVISSIRRAAASLRSREKEVSRMSEEVTPRWIHFEAGPTRSETA